ncbi:MAG TPA: ferrous iron transport protein B [Anaerovoracaceae bacterium]|nr:ferrous iron transport protein B [Anaerovoracaceae bacterium]
MSIKIALAGNPNSGKTTLFNELTGSSQYVGNWPGVTVEKKEGKLRNHKDVIIQDLPGIYSLSPYSLEEVVSRNYLVNDKPNVIIDIVDGSNIERNLYLTTQLTEIGVPVVVALNMIDVVRKSGDIIDIAKLSDALGCEVIETSALKGIGLKEAAERAVSIAKEGKRTVPRHKFSAPVENALSEIEEQIKGSIADGNKRWYAIKLFERDAKVLEQTGLSPNIRGKIENIIASCEAALDDDSESIITNERYTYISEIIKKCVLKKNKERVTASDKIDRIVTNRWLALPIFAAVIWLIYYVSISTVGTIVTDWTNDTLFGGLITNWATSGLEAAGASDWVVGLIVDGIIGGVGSVLGFVPQMFILFFFLSLLEDSGYMARVAFIMDRIFRKFGLSGKSFIPILIGSGCGVPGIMATRTIENDRDRKITIMVTTFMPCGAKLAIIAMMTATFFRGSTWIGPSMYFLGIAMIIISGIILKKMRFFAGDPAPFVMELPQYHVPSFKGVVIHMWERVKLFIIKAGTIIFVACGVIWFLSSFNWGLQLVENADDSILAAIGNVIAPLFAPLGFGTWQGAVASISALVAKENAVGTFGVLFGIGADVAEDAPALITGITSMFTVVSGLSFLIFNLFNPPCFAAIGATKREMISWKWTLIAIGYQMLLGYTLAFIVNQLGSVLVLGAPFGVGAALSLVIIAIVVWLLVRKPSSEKVKLPPVSNVKTSA